jgi:hypothetical protein
MPVMSVAALCVDRRQQRMTSASQAVWTGSTGGRNRSTAAQLAAGLALLTAHRADLVADRVRLINRLRTPIA